jgi:hypothetical protein
LRCCNFRSELVNLTNCTASFNDGFRCSIFSSTGTTAFSSYTSSICNTISGVTGDGALDGDGVDGGDGEGDLEGMGMTGTTLNFR